MRIAQIAPLAEAVPPILYGGTERVVSWLTEELVAQGHDVTLFASGDSVTGADLVPIVKQALRLDGTVKDTMPYHVTMLDKVFQRAAEFDVLHFHIDILHYPLFRGLSDRMVTTLHGRLDLPDLWPFYMNFPEMPLVSISDNQRKPMPPVNWVNTIYHGLPAGLHRPNYNPEGYFAFLGRVSPEKGPEHAIEIAKRTGTTLKIAAKVDNADKVYFEERVKPLLDHPLIEFIGEIDETQKTDFLGNAKALLFPINWPEPFGLVMIEAMACATPVVAYRHGSVPEVLDNGVTGYVVNDLEEAVTAAGWVGSLDRRRIRHVFDTRFTAERMAQNYVATYERLIRGANGASKAA
ncbi:MAG TPA: glycosyltransferase family 4 protein [Rhizomicrobium sp.]|jgi:glycosyltransferase involved in cell wall biosynthesis